MSSDVTAHWRVKCESIFLVWLVMDYLNSSLSQVIVMGLVFLFIFSAYITIQAFAGVMYPTRLGSETEASLYLSFTFFCFLSPAVTNKVGPKMTMFFGCLGYGCLVAASLFYFESGSDTKLNWVVVLGGVMNGVGAALLWTAQGRLIMQYSDGTDNGFLFSIFWALFNLSALVGGLLTFFYFGSSDSDDDDSDSDEAKGSSTLYIVFLCFILAGTVGTQLLKNPEEVKKWRGSKTNLPLLAEETQQMSPTRKRSRSRSRSKSRQGDEESSDWFQEMKETIALFKTRRMVLLFFLFLYTGYNQPYQLTVFGNRFFMLQTNGLEIIVFYLSEIIGGLYVGSMLDRSSSQRSAAKRCLLLFAVVTSLSFLLCYFQERPCAFSGDDKCVKKINYYDKEAVVPTIIYALWGFSDSQIQTYSYWLMGSLFETGVEQARAVGFYKMVQSLGWSIGFFLTGDIMEPIVQMLCTAACFAVGLALSLKELPKESIM